VDGITQYRSYVRLFRGIRKTLRRRERDQQLSSSKRKKRKPTMRGPKRKSKWLTQPRRYRLGKGFKDSIFSASDHGKGGFLAINLVLKEYQRGNGRPRKLRTESLFRGRGGKRLSRKKVREPTWNQVKKYKGVIRQGWTSIEAQIKGETPQSKRTTVTVKVNWNGNFILRSVPRLP